MTFLSLRPSNGIDDIYMTYTDTKDGEESLKITYWILPSPWRKPLPPPTKMPLPCLIARCSLVRLQTVVNIRFDEYVKSFQLI